MAGDDAGGDGGVRTDQGGGPSPVNVALWPTYSTSQGTGDARAVQAAVAALSVGSLTLPIHEKWNELSGATGSPRAVVWRRLDAVIDPYRDRGGSVALCIDIVDRTLPAWPFLGELDAERAEPAIRATIDEAFKRYGAQLSLLCFGYELDRYVAQASSGERQRLLELVEYAVGYARTAARHAHLSTVLGVAVTLDALVSPHRAAVDDFRRLGDQVVAVYNPFRADVFELKQPTAIADELTSALATLSQSGDMPLALFEVGYPTAALGSSQKAQRDYFGALFDALDGVREQDEVSFVGMYGLGDRAAVDCEAEALAFGVPAGVSEEEATEVLAARAIARCSMGLRAENGEPKLAWESALAALSRYAL